MEVNNIETGVMDANFNTGLGRLVSIDFRDKKHLMSAKAPSTVTLPTYKYWTTGKVLDQGATSQCVAFSGEQFLVSGPVTNKFYKTPAELYNECQVVDEWEGECVDMETQCLSKRGWLNGQELRIGDEILTYDIESGGLRWMPVEKVHCYKNKKYRIWSNSKGFEKAVTDNHKWLVANRNTGLGVHLRGTVDLRNVDAILLAAKSLEQPRIPTVNDNFVELMAWTLTEGSYRPNTRRGNGVIISQKKYMGEVSEVVAGFTSIKGSLNSQGCRAWELSGDIARQLRETAPNRAPKIEWFLQLTQRQLELFIETCIKGDGSIVEASGNRQERLMFHQLPNDKLDSFLIACVLAGKSLGRSRVDSITGCESWTLKKATLRETRKLVPSDYIDGEVWCPQTSAGTFVAKRGGNIFLTGNSYDGTSVRALFKVLQSKGYIESYSWAFNINDVVTHLLSKGPVVLGTDWYNSMFETDESNFMQIFASSGLAGGHAYMIKGANTKKICPDGSLGAIRVINSWGCYDDKTEVLTLNGWKNFKHLYDDDLIATLNPKTQKLEYQKSEKFHEYDFKGEMHNYKARNIDLSVTPNHNIYYKKLNDTNIPESWKLEKSENIDIRHLSMKKNAGWDGKEKDFYIVGDKVVKMDDWLEFLGYFISEGHATKSTSMRKPRIRTRKYKTKDLDSVSRDVKTRRYMLSDAIATYEKTYISTDKARPQTSYVVGISQTKVKNLDKIQECLNKLPFKFSKSKTGWSTNNKALWEELSKLGKCHEKYIPKNIKELSSRQLHILYDALMLGDGSCTMTNTGEANTYYTSSSLLSDDFQELLLKIGYSGDLKIIDRTNLKSSKGYKYNHLEYIIQIQKIYTAVSSSGGLVPELTLYDGKVYCVTVPNHIIYVRRNGKGVWSGNSSWGDRGYAWLSFKDADRLIQSWGEACTSTELKFKVEATG